jgi:hypothetical protein
MTMKVYGFKAEQLVEVIPADTVEIMCDTASERGERLLELDGWELVSDDDAPYEEWRAPDLGGDMVPGYVRAFGVEGWILVMRDHLPDYLEALRLLQPLIQKRQLELLEDLQAAQPR